VSSKINQKIRAGLYLSITALFTISISALIAWVSFFQACVLQIVLGFVGLGGLLVIGGLAQRRVGRGKAGETSPAEEFDQSHPLGFFRRMDFWGAAFLVSAGPILFLNREYLRKPVSAPVPVVARPVAPAAPIAVPVQFPEMRLQGFVCNGDKSTAVIDGHTVQIGEMHEGVRIVAIGPGGVVLELSGVTNLLRSE
jgi:hypothetical protein